jgi:magnesium transporter
MKHAGFSFSDEEVSRSTAILESSIPRILRLRLPWLVVALAGGLLAGSVIEAYEGTLEAVVALAFFVPVIMDMGGNVGTQASTIFVRGLAVGHIDDRNAMKHFAREGIVGLVIGVIIGGLGAAAAYVWQGVLGGEPYATELAIVVFVGLVAVCVVASVVGYVIPWLAHKAGFDPAAASDPLITTVKDVTALLIYFALAAWLLAELL